MHGNSKYLTPDIGKQIASGIANNLSMQEIADSIGVSSKRYVSDLIYENPEINELCTRARLAQADVIADDIQQTIKDLKESKLAPEIARVALSSMQWLASKRNPKIYGDRQILAGDAENPLQMLAVRLDQAIARQEAPAMIDVTPVAVIPDDGSDLV